MLVFLLLGLVMFALKAFVAGFGLAAGVLVALKVAKR